MKRILSLILSILLVCTTLTILPPPVEAATKEDWLWPVADCLQITSNFGYRTLNGKKDEHEGIDISKGTRGSGVQGKPVRAAKSGTIITSKSNCTHDNDDATCTCNGRAGNYIVIDHHDGTYSRYLHLLAKGMHAKGDVKQGEIIGYVGSSGESYGYHLHFDMCKDINNMKKTMFNPMPTNSEVKIKNSYSLPSGWPTAKTTYIFELCDHVYDDVGVCKKCKKEFDFGATYKTDSAGYYKVSLLTGIFLRPTKPYSAAEAGSVRILFGTKVEVLGSVTNAFGNKWYKVAYGKEIGYTSADNLTFDSYGDQSISCTVTSPAENAKVPKASYPVKGTVTSKYPLKQVRAYIDGKLYATVNVGSATTLDLQPTDINYDLSFSSLSVGSHTLKIEAKDIHHDSFITVCTRKFNTVSSSSSSCSHSYSGKVTTAATCGKAGVKTYTCSKCKATYTEVIAATGKHTYSSTVTTAPTCVAEGVKTFKCSGCTASYVEPIEPTGKHTYSGTVTTAATCTAKGVKTYKCSGCSASYTESIPAVGHTSVTDPAVAATCTKTGLTQGSHCSVCGEILLAQTATSKKDHSWVGGNCTTAKTCSVCGTTTGGPTHTYSNQYDYKCDLCGAERSVNMKRETMDMYRMYDPNSGEHFYTGSPVERDNLVAAGWNYEGVGFTFPLATGAPVHRLYDPVYGEHLYTMDVEEMNKLLAAGWNYEGIAFNSGFENEVPQYRLHNPNETRGAYHFTASLEERNFLISIGWEDQGIGWYSCWY